LEVGEVFGDFVPAVSVRGERACAWPAFVQPLKVIEVGSEVTEEDGDVDGVLEVGVADMESIEGSGRNVMGIEGFIAASLGGQ
jgi:hypothetical protein